LSDIAIRVENLGKRYRIGHAQKRHDTLRDAIADSKSQIANSVVRLLRSPSAIRHQPPDDFIWALKDVSFDIKRGEVVGIIGRNGAGKSTLLKILSRITKPTEGYADIYGRVRSLLEVGTGFHAELTGRENIYLSGAIQGMSKAEIDRKFDEIVAFAEVDKFIDTPVKHYSSGMYVRLAFAVAAHLEPEILLVDEVLAVGDAAFQKKCLGKMGDVAREGRTVLFVSHNMTAITTLCPRVLVVYDGHILRDGNTAELVSSYLSLTSNSNGEIAWEGQSSPGNEKIRLQRVRIISNGRVTSEVDIDKDIQLEVEFWNLKPGVQNLCANIYILDSLGGTVLSTANIPSANLLSEEWYNEPHPAGLFRATCTLPGNFLNEGTYYLSIYMVTLDPLTIEAQAMQVLSFRVFDTGEMRRDGNYEAWQGVVRVRLPWRTDYLYELNSLALPERIMIQ